MADVMNLQRQTVRYELADGIRDFQSALWVLLIGFYAWIVWDVPEMWLVPMQEFRDSTGNRVAAIIIFAVSWGLPYLVLFVTQHLMNEYVRRRWLWRETGFIKSKAMILPRGVGLVGGLIGFITLIGGILLTIQLRDFSIFIRSSFVGAGFAQTYMYFMLGRRFEIARYRLVSIVGLAGTVFIALLPLSGGLICLLISLWWTAVLVVSGISGVREVAALQRELADAA